jgi:hypothetical protein
VRSLGRWFLVLIPIVALVTMALLEVRRSINLTADWRDLAVCGRGYIHTVDDNGENPIWLRYVRLAINLNGVLCASVDGELRPLEPRVTIPSDWTAIDIDSVGDITINTSDSSGLAIGAMLLTTFVGDERDDPILIRNEDDRLGPPTIAEPGSSGGGLLMQRATIEYSLPLTRRTVIMLVAATVWFAVGLFWRSPKNGT